jgi:hypothetical protein
VNVLFDKRSQDLLFALAQLNHLVKRTSLHRDIDSIIHSSIAIASNRIKGLRIQNSTQARGLSSGIEADWQSMLPLC